MDFRPVEEVEEHSDSEGGHGEEAKELEKTTKREGDKKDTITAGKNNFLGIHNTLHS